MDLEHIVLLLKYQQVQQQLRITATTSGLRDLPPLVPLRIIQSFLTHSSIVTDLISLWHHLVWSNMLYAYKQTIYEAHNYSFSFLFFILFSFFLSFIAIYRLVEACLTNDLSNPDRSGVYLHKTVPFSDHTKDRSTVLLRASTDEYINRRSELRYQKKILNFIKTYPKLTFGPFVYYESSVRK